MSKEPVELVDTCVMDLAKHFLSGGTSLLGEPQDCVENRIHLARHIQAAVEDWFMAFESK